MTNFLMLISGCIILYGVPHNYAQKLDFFSVGGMLSESVANVNFLLFKHVMFGGPGYCVFTKSCSFLNSNLL